jgi:hypothetical protein
MATLSNMICLVIHLFRGSCFFWLHSRE